MNYLQRFTDRLCFKDDEVGGKTTYTAIMSEEAIVQRLGFYEDLGFSPQELADILIDYFYDNNYSPDQIELLKVAKMRMDKYKHLVHYPINSSV